MRTFIYASIILSSTLAIADTKPTMPPAPATPPTSPTPPAGAKPATPTTPATPATPPTGGAPTTPTTPEVPPANPLPPAEGTSPTPATPPVPVEPAKPAPTFTDTTPSAGSSIGDTIVDDGGPSSVSSSSEAPAKGGTKIALEISGAGASAANQYIEYKGWRLEHGPSKGVRLEVSLIGIQLGYELSSMTNEQMCSVDCITGSFGSTTIHSVELGYRFRFAKIGPVRPFVAASLGGVIASSGDWSMSTSKSVYGGSGRAGLGIEIPIVDRFFVSATLAYRIVVTENPLRNADAETADKILLGNDVPNGDYAEDLHLISGYVGFGVQL